MRTLPRKWPATRILWRVRFTEIWNKCLEYLRIVAMRLFLRLKWGKDGELETNRASWRTWAETLKPCCLPCEKYRAEILHWGGRLLASIQFRDVPELVSLNNCKNNFPQLNLETFCKFSFWCLFRALFDVGKYCEYSQKAQSFKN